MNRNSALKEVSSNADQPRSPRRKRSQKQLQTKQPLDADLVAAANNAIEILTTVPQETITVTARNGWLHLDGTVNWQAQRTTVEDVTRHLPGVRGVIDSITITSGTTQTDPWSVFR